MPGLIEPLVPDGTALDLWKGDAVISLIGFLFKNTRVMGMRASNLVGMDSACASVSGPMSSLYGPAFAEVLSTPPRSAFVAVGSGVSVHRGVRIAPTG